MKLGDIVCNHLSCSIKVKLLFKHKHFLHDEGRKYIYTTVAVSRGLPVSSKNIIKALKERYKIRNRYAPKEFEHDIISEDYLTYSIISIND